VTESGSSVTMRPSKARARGPGWVKHRCETRRGARMQDEVLWSTKRRRVLVDGPSLEETVMARSLLITSILLLALLLTAAAPSLGLMHRGDGPGFGDHVSEMAPEHPRMHGHMFGECVSSMARGIDCPHHTHHHG
jgi:hypothetical protein